METAGPTCGLPILRLSVTLLQQVALKPAVELMEEPEKMPW